MSNPLHDRATRVVSIALLPAFLGVFAMLVWGLLPLPTVASGSGLPTRPAVDDTVSIPDLRAVAADAPATSVNPAPRAISPAAPPATVKPKTRHCDEYAMYNGSNDKVLICDWE